MNAKEKLALVRRQMSAIARSSVDLDDLVQTAFFELERSAFRGECQFSTFSHSICYRVWQKHRKKTLARRLRFREWTERDDGVLSSEPEASPQRHLEDKRERAHVRHLLSCLSKAQREALVLYYFEGLDAEQISLRSATRVSTVHTRLRDGRAALGRLLANLELGDVSRLQNLELVQESALSSEE